MSSRFAGSVLLLQEAVGVSHHHFISQPRLGAYMWNVNSAYNRQPRGIELLLCTCSGIFSRQSSTVQHDVRAGVHSLHRQPCLSCGYGYCRLESWKMPHMSAGGVSRVEHWLNPVNRGKLDDCQSRHEVPGGV